MTAAPRPAPPGPDALAEVTRAVLARAGDPAGAVGALAGGLGAALGARQVVVLAGPADRATIVASPPVDEAEVDGVLRAGLAAAAARGRFDAGATASALGRSLDGARVAPIDAGGAPLGLVAIAGAADLGPTGAAELAAATRALGLVLARPDPAAPALANDEARYRALLDAVPYAVLQLDASGTVIDLKPGSAHVVLGPAAVGRHIGEVVPSRTAQPLRRALRDALRTREPQQLDCVVDHETGRRFWEVRVVATGPDVAFVVVHDVTRRRRFEDEVRELNAQLERRVAERTKEVAAAGRELESFLAATVEGLRDPLRRLDELARPASAVDELARGEPLRGAIAELVHTVEGLGELARIARTDVAREPVDVSALAIEVASTLRGRPAEGGARLRVEDGLAAMGDRTLLRWALEELLENAFRASGGGPDATVHVGATSAGGEPAFFVRDDGDGFEPAAAHRLYRPFSRLDDGHGGAGLGLAIVARVVERHGGRVWAESRRGEGATFYFTLPAPEAP